MCTNTWSVENIGTNEKVVFVDGHELKRGKNNTRTVGLESTIMFRNESAIGDLKEGDTFLFTVRLVEYDCIPFPILPETVHHKNRNVVLLEGYHPFNPVREMDIVHHIHKEYAVNPERDEHTSAGVTNENNISHASSSPKQHKDTQTFQHKEHLKALVESNRSSSDIFTDGSVFEVAHSEPDVVSGENHHASVYFLQRGQNMSKTRVGLLVKALQQKNLHLCIKMEFDKLNPPEYIVIDPNLPVEAAQKELGFQDLGEMANILEKVHFVTPEWIIECTTSQSHVEVMMAPTISHCWKGSYFLRNYHREILLEKNQETFVETDEAKRQKISHNCVASVDQKTLRLRQISSGYRDDSICEQHRTKNQQLSKMFDAISKLYQECPLSTEDTWRSYSYNIVSKRLLSLSFEVTSDAGCLKKLSSIKGFGPKVLNQVRM
jgi:hypothetical protein